MSKYGEYLCLQDRHSSSGEQLAGVHVAGISQLLRDISSTHRLAPSCSQQALARKTAMRQITCHLCQYVLDESPAGAYTIMDVDGERTGICTRPTLLAVALEHQQARAEVNFICNLHM